MTEPLQLQHRENGRTAHEGGERGGREREEREKREKDEECGPTSHARLNKHHKTFRDERARARRSLVTRTTKARHGRGLKRENR